MISINTTEYPDDRRCGFWIVICFREHRYPLWFIYDLFAITWINQELFFF